MPYYIVVYKEEVTYECRLHASCEEDAWKLIGNRDYDMLVSVDAKEVLEVTPD